MSIAVARSAHRSFANWQHPAQGQRDRATNFGPPGLTQDDILKQVQLRYEWLRRREVARTRLNRRLEYIVRHVPAYEHFRGTVTIAAFPCVSESELRRNFTNYVSDECLAGGGLNYSNSNVLPVDAVRDGASVYSNTFGNIERVFETYANELDLPLPDQSLFTMMEIGSAPSEYTSIHIHLNFGQVTRATIGSDEVAAGQISNISTSCPVVLAGTVQTFGCIGKIWSKAQSTRGPQLILCTGGILPESLLQKLHEMYCAPVVHGYTTPEAGLIALECIESGNLHVMQDASLVEVATPSGKVLPEGHGEIVVTVLDNHYFGLVRYRTGDLAELSFEQCSCGYFGPTITNWRHGGFQRRDTHAFV